jgi:FkbM family methyltransferase
VAALRTTVGERGTLLKKPVNTEEFWNEGLDAVLKYEGDKALKERTIACGREWALGQVWSKIAKCWQGGLFGVPGNTTMFERLRVLKKFGFEPKLVLDIGANVGQWNIGFKRIYPDCRVVSFEANEECFENLERNNIEFHGGLLGSGEKSEMDFYFSGEQKAATGASVFREKTCFYDDNVAVSYKVPVKVLDDVIEEIVGTPVERFDMIKIDVQGAELEVLKGGLGCLAKTDIVLLEISVMRYNEGAPLLADVVRFMDEHGFSMFDIVENHYINDCCMQVDALFLKRSSAFTKSIAKSNAENTFWKVDDIYA